MKARVPEALVIAPHPFYPISSALGARLDGLVDVVDALEINAMYTRGLDYNRRARTWAARHGKALVGNTDLHRLDQIGTTWSEVDAPADADAICAAIRAGHVVVRSQPISWTRALWTMARMELGGLGRAPALGHRATEGLATEAQSTENALGSHRGAEHTETLVVRYTAANALRPKPSL